MLAAPTIPRIPSWNGVRGSVFYGDSALPAPLLDECFKVFTKYSIQKESISHEDKDIGFSKVISKFSFDLNRHGA